jgi:hypothetical protein
LANPGILLISIEKLKKLGKTYLAMRNNSKALTEITHSDGRDPDIFSADFEYVICPSQWDPKADFSGRYFETSVGFQVKYAL